MQPAVSARTQDRGAVAVGFGHLAQGSVEDVDVVGGGVRAGVAAAQLAGEKLPGVVAERQHRVIPERPLERRRRLFLLRMADHDRGVQIDHQAGQLAAGRGGRWERRPTGLAVLGPGHLAGRRSRPRDPGQPGVVDAVEQPPTRRVRGHRPEQRRLVLEHRHIRDGARPVSDRDRHVDQHPPRVVRPPPTRHRQLDPELAGQRGGIREIGQQP